MTAPLILDLCGGTGAWSRPYREAGYRVEVVTFPLFDVRTYEPPDGVHGVFAAPPCEHFSVSGAQYWGQKDADGRTAEAADVVRACLRIVERTRPAFWALENPIGRIAKLVPELGGCFFQFDPCDFGDPYTKKTRLWGEFRTPRARPVEPERVCSQGSWLMRLGGTSEKTKRLRSATPPHFSQAFFEANP